MSENGDKRRRSDLDLFVLALVAAGVSTPYRMQVDAGLSPGATIPALRRLVQGGWTLQSKPGARGRTEYRVTPVGRRHLKTGWQDLMNKGATGDFDADLRVALLSLAMGGGRSKAISFLRASAVRHEHLPVAGMADQETPPTLAFSYRRLRQIWARTVATAQSGAVVDLIEQIPPRVARGSSVHLARK
jgi:hypothetical protein